MNFQRLFFAVCFFTLFGFESFFVHAITVEITATVSGCGDTIISGGEQCEGSNLGGSSCSSLGFGGGTLSCTSACTFNTSQCTLNTGGGGGGSGNTSPVIPSTNVVFSGRAYPLRRVTILKDAQVVLTTIAGSDGNFTGTISGLSTGNYIFGVYGEDSKGLQSSLFTFPIFIMSDVTTKIGGIFIAPTIATDKTEVKKGDPITIFGQSAPSSEVAISVYSEQELVFQKEADESGLYLLNFDTSVLEMGQYQTKSKSTLQGELSPFSKIVSFLVGTRNVFTENIHTYKKGDVNNDGRVNLVDFSIAAFWYRRPLSDTFKPVEIERLNGDGKIDLIDFSIMAFNWTG